MANNEARLPSHSFGFFSIVPTLWNPPFAAIGSFRKRSSPTLPCLADQLSPCCFFFFFWDVVLKFTVHDLRPFFAFSIVTPPLHAFFLFIVGISLFSTLFFCCPFIFSRKLFLRTIPLLLGTTREVYKSGAGCVFLLQQQTDL